MLVITRVPLDSLHLDSSNARSHPDENLDAIFASLSRFGQAEPLVVQQETRRVIGGNGRLVAMRKLGWTECDVVELTVDDLEATALGIALNRTAETAEWDEPILARLLKELREEEALDGVGFDDSDLDELLNELEEDEDDIEDPGADDPPENPVTRTGDLWKLGSHRLLCGDSTNADDVARLFGDVRPGLMVTDPPYGVSYRPTWRQDAGLADAGRTAEVANDDRVDWTDAWRLFPGDVAYVWHAGVHAPVGGRSTRRRRLRDPIADRVVEADIRDQPWSLSLDARAVLVRRPQGQDGVMGRRPFPSDRLGHHAGPRRPDRAQHAEAARMHASSDPESHDRHRLRPVPRIGDDVDRGGAGETHLRRDGADAGIL